MPKIRSILRSEIFIELAIITLISGLLYLIFIPWVGYFNDDWYLMYAAGAKGPIVFRDIFIVDRPLRALVMVPAYILFRANPLNYNISAYIFRLLSAFGFLWLLRMLWPRQRVAGISMALLFLIYPGFLSQFNGIDYQSQMVSLAAGMFSIALTIRALHSTDIKVRLVLFFLSAILTLLYLGLVEYFIGLEFLRAACIFIVITRTESLWLQRIKTTLFQWLSALIPSVLFLVWRLFFFESERGATDVDLQLGGLRSEPLTFLFKYFSVLLNDIVDVLINAWWVPLYRLSGEFKAQQWIPGFGIALLALLLLWMASRVGQKPGNVESAQQINWKREATWLGFGLIVFGLLPVILVGRTVDFKSYTRYSLISSAGVAILLIACLSYISSIRLRNILFSLLIVSAAFTHFANGLARVGETEATRNFWWQVSWRIPQLEQGTTLISHYSVVAEEDYFTWGPANLIYSPESVQEDFAQPAIYAALLNDGTVSKVLAREPQEYSNRRSIVTYPNHRNILVLTQPTSTSCVQVVDHNAVELALAEDDRVVAMAPYSEPEHILLNESFHVPPSIPFGDEPSHGWCYYYQKASYARQIGDWAEVVRLDEEAQALDLSTNNPIEWMPFLQASAYFDNAARVKEIASFVTSDLFVAQQACQILTAMPLSPSTLKLTNEIFCLEK